MYRIPNASTLPGNDTMTEPFAWVLITLGRASHLRGIVRLKEVKDRISSVIWFISLVVESVSASLGTPWMMNWDMRELA